MYGAKSTPSVSDRMSTPVYGAVVRGGGSGAVAAAAGRTRGCIGGVADALPRALVRRGEIRPLRLLRDGGPRRVGNGAVRRWPGRRLRTRLHLRLLLRLFAAAAPAGAAAEAGGRAEAARAVRQEASPAAAAREPCVRSAQCGPGRSEWVGLGGLRTRLFGSSRNWRKLPVELRHLLGRRRKLASMPQHPRPVRQPSHAMARQMMTET